MEKLTASDICKIIKSCRENKVSHFLLSSLRIEFVAPETIIKEVISDLHIQNPELSLEKRALLKKEQYEELLEEAKLANPTLYEELVGREDELDESH